MGSKSEIRSNIDNSKLLVKLSLLGAVLTLVILIVLMILGVGSDTFVRSNLFAMGVIPYIMALLFSVSALLYGILSSGAAQEEEEKMLIDRRKESASILSVEEDVRFTAGRTFSNYKRYSPYVLAILGALILAGALIYFYHLFNVVQPASLLADAAKNLQNKKVATPAQLSVISIIFMTVSAFIGAFYNGQSRVAIFRWLRPLGGWMSAGFLVMLFSTLNGLFLNWDILDWYEPVMIKVCFILYIFLGAELVINFIIEFYRPRSLEESRPIFESKILSIFTEPGGVMRNIADALDYQFGFKVSGTWIYSFIEKALFPLIIFWALILWGFTSIHAVKVGEVGVRESFGKVMTKDLLEPGIYFSKPWPLGNIRCFSCMKLQQIFVGEDPTQHKDEEEEEADDGHGHSKPAKKPKVEDKRYVITWTEGHSHGKEGDDYFLIANNSGGRKEVNAGNGSNALDLVGFCMPVQYRIKRDGIFDYAYLNLNPEKAILKISQEAAVNYLAGASLNEIMATGRKNLENSIKKSIQARIDQEKLGVEIVTVNLTDVHPPAANKTAESFHETRIAQEKAGAAILDAEVYRDRLLPEAQINAYKIKEEALSYEYNTRKIADAESGRFLTQLKSYQVMPSMFMLKTYLDFLEQDCADIRKFIISESLKNEVYELNFEEKGALDLMDVDLESFGQR